MRDIRVVVDDPTWQRLRRRLVGTWKGFPEMNVLLLRDYFREWPTDPDRARRVLNYLTGSGFRTRQITHPLIDKLLAEVRVVCNQLREENKL